MVDPNGCNTTAVAAVVSASKHATYAGAKVAILGGTGPVGQRVAQLTGSLGAEVRVCSRNLEKARAVCELVTAKVPAAQLHPVQTENSDHTLQAIDGAEIVIAAGAAGKPMLIGDWFKRSPAVRVAIDLNAVPPSGISGIESSDYGTIRNQVKCYGAIGVGGLKMKIHRRSIQALFDSNRLAMDIDEIYRHALDSN
jgi:5,10-methylene-tetrahydrofolate dehydrogenase/methenyl tetrahydrofolate cyclohydrolase